MQCDFNHRLLNARSCEISDQVIHNENTNVEITNAKQFTDVRGFSMFKSQIFYFPLGIDKCFPELTSLWIKDCQLRKITAENLKGFPHITYLELSNNNLVILEANLFKFNPKLEEIHLQKNIISFIDPTAFNGLNNLKKVDLSDNKNCYSSLRLILGNAQVVAQKLQNSSICPHLQEVMEEPSKLCELSHQSLKLKLMFMTLLFSTVIIGLHLALRMILYRKPSRTKATKKPFSKSKSRTSNSRTKKSQSGIISNSNVSPSIRKIQENLYSNASYEEAAAATASEDFYSEVEMMKEIKEDAMSQVESPIYSVVNKQAYEV
ncbi:hypothetical protein ACKWTF_014172 [Chironomus riparius]